MTPPPSVQSATKGLTNGVGQTNGLGKVNGTGTRGGAFVNGTGVTTGSRSADTGAKGRAASNKWKFVAVLVALIIVIPTFVLLSNTKTNERFAIDGNFSDWAGVPRFGAETQSSVPSANLMAWSIDSQGSDLFLYVVTQEAMMTSPTAESLYLFVDSDGAAKTGYAVESLGADYMLELTGWSSSVGSTSLFRYDSTSDQLDWTEWTQIGPLACSLNQNQLEAKASLPDAPRDSAKFILVSKDSSGSGAVSSIAPLTGGLLVISMTPSSLVASSGIVPSSTSVEILSLKFTCEGEAGTVSQLSPEVAGARLAGSIAGFVLAPGETKVVNVTVDTSATSIGSCVSAQILASRVSSTFSAVEIIGSAASAYVGNAPAVIEIDGAFADWNGRLSVDRDLTPVADANVDIQDVGNVSDSQDSSFFVSVKGEICSGAFVPAVVARPSGTDGGGLVIPSRRTAEDTLTIYIDSDKSAATGESHTLDSKTIGADQKIVIKGLFGRITSKMLSAYSSGAWTNGSVTVAAAKDEQRMEIGIPASGIGGSSDIDFILETTSWKGREDLAIFDPNTMVGSTRAWVVDPNPSSSYATSMSYQRKMLNDGVNCWSFYFDGSNTVTKYSIDQGRTWTSGGRVFSTTGVNETSIWYDPSIRTVYAVGDGPLASKAVLVQAGTVSPFSHLISWAVKDYFLNTSSQALAGKNAFISKDRNGFLWILSSNCTVAGNSYQLSAFRSFKANSTATWVVSGQMLAVATGADTVKGSIVPAGSGSDVWAVYTYAGNVASRKFTGAWQTPQSMIYTQAGSRSNTENSPPSVVVDGKGVVHVVYGTGRRAGGLSAPAMMYSHNYTGQTNFTTSVNLDPLLPTGLGDYSPTVTLDSSTGDIYALWLRSDATLTPITVMGKVQAGGAWANMTFGSQTGLPKHYLTSAYSVGDVGDVGWQWTQNDTAPIEVLYDTIPVPEFGGMAPVVACAAIPVVWLMRRREKQTRI